ncbi:MAG: hypothetical protein ICV78_16355 [Tolypothrix sp. Co-bin9]|nr:hypothetical protein [Tolypothrix sp. Co-bin9]
MSISPFFSGRIPQELYDKADQYCKETGKKRTELLIEALSTYLNFPVKTQTTNFVPQPAEVTKEMFNSLQEQVNRLEKLLSQSQPAVIIQDSVDNNELPHDDNQPTVIRENSTDNSQVSHDDIEPDNNTDNTEINSKVSEDSTELVVTESDNSTDNKENQDVDREQNPVYDSITSAMVIEKTGLKQTQIDGLRAKIANQYKKEGKPLTAKSLLEKPEEVKTNSLITVDNYPCQLFYLGQNPKGQNLWKLAPDDNTNYQPIITQLNYANSGNDNADYQHDNKNFNSQENEQNTHLDF